MEKKIALVYIAKMAEEFVAARHLLDCRLYICTRAIRGVPAGAEDATLYIYMSRECSARALYSDYRDDRADPHLFSLPLALSRSIYITSLVQ